MSQVPLAKDVPKDKSYRCKFCFEDVVVPGEQVHLERRHSKLLSLSRQQLGPHHVVRFEILLPELNLGLEVPDLRVLLRQPVNIIDH